VRVAIYERGVGGASVLGAALVILMRARQPEDVILMRARQPEDVILMRARPPEDVILMRAQRAEDLLSPTRRGGLGADFHGSFRLGRRFSPRGLSQEQKSCGRFAPEVLQTWRPYVALLP